MRAEMYLSRDRSEPTECVREQLNGESISKSFLAIVERLEGGKGAARKIGKVRSTIGKLSEEAPIEAGR